MSEWKQYNLGEIINVKHGYAFKGEYFSESPTLDILLTPGNFNIGGGFKKGKLKYYNGSYPISYILNEGDIIVTMTDLSKEGDTLGYSAKIPKHSELRYLHNQRIGLLQFINYNFCKDYIYWVLRSRDYQKFIINSATGSTVKHTSPSRIGEYIFSAPDLPTQTAIAEILSSLDAKIELNDIINQELENLAQTLFKRWFIDFEFPNENGEPYKSSGGEMVDSELGEIPKGWQIDKIGRRYEVTDFVANGSFASLKENVSILEQPSYALFLRNTDSKSNFTGQMRYVDERTYNYLAKSKIIGNEICISNVADVGTVFRPPVYLNKPMTLGNNLVLFRSNSPGYFYFYFKYFFGQYQIQSITSGSAQLKFNKTDFRNLAIMVVPQIILELFEHMVGDFTTMQFQILAENIKLTNLRETLFPKLISGELEVNETSN